MKDRKATKLEQLREDLMGACARGYTYDENSSKELDSDLIKAMVEELTKLFIQKIDEIVNTERKNNFENNQKKSLDLQAEGLKIGRQQLRLSTKYTKSVIAVLEKLGSNK